MEDTIKRYADALCERELFESSRLLGVERTKFAHEMAARRTTTPLPLSGPEIQTLTNLFVRHVERCMEARFESYRTAYTEANRTPTEADFKEILASIQDVQRSQSGNAAQALSTFVTQQGGNRVIRFDLVPNTARAHDRILGNLKVWLAWVQVRKAEGTDDDKFSRLAIEEAKLSATEDERVHPRVGAVIVLNGTVLSKAHRGESPGAHAEFIALEEKLRDVLVAGATVYTTLEPCTTRNHPKIPCARRLMDRRVARVVIGMLDPNPQIRGLGEQLLNEAGIETQLFPRDLRSQVEEMNRDFIRVQKERQTTPQLANNESRHEMDPKIAEILKHRGKVVTVLNRQKYGHGYLEGFWANGAVVVDCNSLWVVLAVC